jgi:hypothetical protein
MPCPTPCSQCDRSGLPILFTRYAAAYHHDPQLQKKLRALAPKGHLQAQPGGVPISAAAYGVRMLREGYLYLVIERSGPSYPEDQLAYSVHPHGYLNAFAPELDSQPPAPKVACDVETRAANNSLVFVRDAKTVKALWYAFHPNALASDTWAEMRKKPAEYGMQLFDAKAWANGQRTAQHSLLPNQLQASVLEFAALQDAEYTEASESCLFGLMGMTPKERGWGRYDTTVGEVMQDHRAGRLNDEQVRAAAQRDDQKGWAHNATPTVITQPDYAQAHGRRLANVAKLLQSHRGSQGQPMPGAVLACLDPLGIAQELAMAQTEAAAQYVQWLQTADDENKTVSNRMKDAAANGIDTMQAAFRAKAVKTTNDTVASLQESAQLVEAGHILGSMPGKVYAVRQSDGSLKNVTQEELNRQRAQDMRQRASAAQADQGAAQDRAAQAVQQLVDETALKKFKDDHRQQLDKRDKAMNTLFEDLAPWLDAKAPWQPVFKRYTSARPEVGAQCAGQLCNILMHVDNSPKGREYLRKRDVLMPGAQQLVWRMIALNNEAIAAEIKGTLAALTQPVPSVLDAQADGQAAQAAAAFMAALSSSKKFIAGADKARSAHDKQQDPTKRDTALTAGEFVRAGMNNIGSLIGAFAVNQVKAWPATALEKRLAHAQLLSLVHGMGSQAVEHVRQQAGQRVGNPAKRARELQGRLNKATASAASAAGKLRLAVAGGVFDALGLVPALRRAALRQDTRSAAEAAQALVNTGAAMHSLRSTVYDTLLYKTLPESVGAKSQEAVKAVNTAELRRLKKTAAHWISAGTAIMVVMDAFDAVEAGRNGDQRLAYAYGGRAFVGLVTIRTTIAAAGFETVPKLLARTNLALAIATGVLSMAIVQIKGEAWANWLKKQPFHKADSDKTPYSSERAQMLDLGEALAEIGGA